MNIGLIAYKCTISSGTRAGVQLACALAKNNKVTFYAFTQQSDTQVVRYLKKNKVEVTLFSKSNVPLVGWVIDFLTLLKILKKSPHHILSTHTIVSLTLAARLSQIPTITTYYGTQWNVISEHFFQYSAIIWLFNWIINIIIYFKGFLVIWIPNHVVSISQYCHSQTQSLFFRKSDLIYLGGELTKSQNIQKKSKKKITFLSVSRITPYKQFHILIKIFNQLTIQYKHLEFIIVGSQAIPSYLNYLESIKSDPVSIKTDIPDSDLMDLYRKTDIYISADRFLFFGLPVVEAAYFGIPIVTYNYAAAPEVVLHDKTGYVANNWKEFKKYCEILIRQKSMRLKLGRKAKEYAKEKFDWEKVADEYTTVFQKMINE